MTFDCIILWGDNNNVDIPILELRLREHKSFVDHFIICEIGTDFLNQKKRTHFNEIMDIAERVGVIVTYDCIEQWPDDLTGVHERNNYWRDRFKSILPIYAEPGDVVICTDLDEIISSRAYNYDVSMGLMAVEFKFYYYYLNLYTGKWHNGFICPYEFIGDKSIVDLRYNYPRRKWDTGLLKEYGWHFSWLGGKEVIKNKFIQGGNIDGWPTYLNDDEAIETMLRDRIRFDNGTQLQLVPIDNTYPEYLRRNMHLYMKYIYEL